MKFVACPEEFRRRYLLKEYDAFSVDRLIGELDHKVIACNFLWKMDLGQDMALENLLGVYHSTWDEAIVKQEPLWGLVSPADTRDLGEMMVTAYREQVAPSVNPIAVEQKFVETIPGVPVPLLGYIDVETQERIIERKTDKTKPTKPKPGWRFQARIYQLAINKPVEFQITTKQKTPQIVTHFTNPEMLLLRDNPDQTVRQIVRIVESMNDCYQRYGAKDPWPTNGVLHDWKCGYCTYGPNHKTTCPAWARKGTTLDEVAA